MKKKCARAKSLPSKDIDPVATHIYVQNMGGSSKTVFPLLKNRVAQTDRAKVKREKTESDEKSLLLKNRKFFSISYDNECSTRFPNDK